MLLLHLQKSRLPLNRMGKMPWTQKSLRSFCYYLTTYFEYPQPIFERITIKEDEAPVAVVQQQESLRDRTIILRYYTRNGVRWGCTILQTVCGTNSESKQTAGSAAGFVPSSAAVSSYISCLLVEKNRLIQRLLLPTSDQTDGASREQLSKSHLCNTLSSSMPLSHYSVYQKYF